MTKVKPKLSKNYKFRDTEEVMAHLIAVLELADEILDEAYHAETEDYHTWKDVEATGKVCLETAEVLRNDKFIQRIFFGSRW